MSARRTRKQVYQGEIDRCRSRNDDRGADFWSDFLCEAELEGIDHLPSPFDFDDQGNIVPLLHVMGIPQKDEAEA